MAAAYKTDTIELRKVMIENDIKTIVDLSIKSGINRNTLSKILDGDIQPSANAMYRLVTTLNIGPERAGRIFFNHNLRTA